MVNCTGVTGVIQAVKVAPIQGANSVNKKASGMRGMKLLSIQASAANKAWIFSSPANATLLAL